MSDELISIKYYSAVVLMHCVSKNGIILLDVLQWEGLVCYSLEVL